ncbi:restriction endonuclease subunit S [Flavobacterium sp.]|uniref:restriction endonuclease subunit S n=1 Tax=Flavobacterium sp. TaxID=239 RepID=UPI002610E586|nr:restriction endonuclease subunit S [Flavobacterium sp.]
MNKNKKLIPEYRFPEFNNQGEWRYKNGDELFEPVSNKNHNSDLSILAITQEQGAIPREMIDYHVSVTDKSVESYKVVEVGDFIISLRSFQGGIEYSNYLGLCSPAYIILRKKIDVVNDFYRFYFKSIPFIRDLNKNLEGIRDGKMVSYKQFSEISIPNPETIEQQKIASCLSSLDEVIAAHVQKLDLLKAHKKGLMQNLFPQEGETVPKFRFKEFKNDGEWEKDTLVNIAKFRRGSFPQPYGLPEWYDDSNGMPFIQVFDVDDNFLLKSKTKRKISKLAAKQSVFIPERTVIITIQGSIGKVAITQFDAYIDRTLLLFEEFYNEIDKVFFAYVLFMLFEIEKEKAPGGIIKTITKEVLSDFIISFPEFKEQQKIAGCLSSLDELITAKARKIEQLMLHKAGLMQGLFPKIID